MTYVVGLKINDYGTSAIICDTKCNAFDDNLRKEVPAVKNGMLFEGCIFGAAGNVDHICRFIDDYLNYLSSLSSNEQLWDKFTTFVSGYDFFEYDSFEMLLSSNWSGKPLFYHLNPKHSFVLQEAHENENLITIGSGKEFFDTKLIDYLADCSKVNMKGTFKPEHFVYNCCAFLMTLSQGYSAIELEKFHCGGYFHFWIQTKTVTQPQKTSLYVISDLFEKKIWPYYYRIGYINNGDVLVIHIYRGNGDQDIHILTSFWANKIDERWLSEMEPFQKLSGEYFVSFSEFHSGSEYIKKLSEKFKNMPLYDFCSFGFSDPKISFRINHFRKKGESFWVLKTDKWEIKNELVLQFLKSMLSMKKAPDNEQQYLQAKKDFLSLINKYTGDEIAGPNNYPEIVFA